MIGSPHNAIDLGLELMLAELEGNQLEVILVPQRHHTNEGGCIRRAVSRNATWYRNFCARHLSGRIRRNFCARHLSGRIRRNLAPDTRIKRRNVLATLQALLRGRRASKYDAELLRIAATLARQLTAA